MASATNRHAGSPLAFSPVRLAEQVRLQTPLSRRGIGPGLLLLIPDHYQGRGGATEKTPLDPEPLQKWAEEGLAVVEVRVSDAHLAKEACVAAIQALKAVPECVSTDRIGILGMYKTISWH